MNINKLIYTVVVMAAFAVDANANRVDLNQDYNPPNEITLTYNWVRKMPDEVCTSVTTRHKLLGCINYGKQGHHDIWVRSSWTRWGARGTMRHECRHVAYGPAHQCDGARHVEDDLHLAARKEAIVEKCLSGFEDYLDNI